MIFLFIFNLEAIKDHIILTSQELSYLTIITISLPSGPRLRHDGNGISI